MIKEFDRWNDSKKRLDQNPLLVDFHEREIWWCSIGVNVGSEQNSQSVDFSRPVIITKKFTERIFWGVPLTTKVRLGEFRIHFVLNNVENDILVLQMRSYDRRRLLRKIGVLSEPDYETLTDSIIRLFPNKTETPQKDGVSSEAEARVCNRSIEDQALLSRFFGDRYFNRYKISSRI